MTNRLVWLLFACLFVVTACDEGYTDFGELLDLTEPIDPESANTWMLIEEDGTLFLTLETLEDTEQGGFIYARINTDGSASVFTGNYALDNGDLDLQASLQF